MVRRRHFYALAAGTVLSLGMAGAIFAQAPAQPNGPSGPAAAPVRPRPNAPALQGGRDPLRELSPQDRQRFQQNLERWRQMPEDRRRELRTREIQRQERIQRDADAALRASGLQLEAERRQQYEQRYIQERRRVEQQLRQELQERRQRELAPVVERLRREFTPQQPTTNSPAAPRNSAAPSPK